MPIAHVNGTDLYYEIYGTGHPVILGHGGGSNHLTWWPQVYDLMNGFTVVTFDHRGFGHSPAGDKGPTAFVDDLVGLVDHLSFDRVSLLGQSMGGYTAAGFASRYPERVASLILSSGGAGLLPLPPGGHSAKAAANALQTKSNDEFILMGRNSDGLFKREPRLNFLFESIGRLNYRLDTPRLTEISAFRYDLAPIAAARIPTLLLAGEEDSSNCEVMRQLVSLIPGSTFKSIANTGHHLFFEKPDECNALVRDFLNKHALNAA
jgi:3-oxoadipate enol-lactonase